MMSKRSQKIGGYVTLVAGVVGLFSVGWQAYDKYSSLDLSSKVNISSQDVEDLQKKIELNLFTADTLEFVDNNYLTFLPTGVMADYFNSSSSSLDGQVFDLSREIKNSEHKNPGHPSGADLYLHMATILCGGLVAFGGLVWAGKRELY